MKTLIFLCFEKIRYGFLILGHRIKNEMMNTTCQASGVFGEYKPLKDTQHWLFQLNMQVTKDNGNDIFLFSFDDSVIFTFIQ